MIRRGWGRVCAALTVALLCAPGTLVRTHVSQDVPTAITMTRISGEAVTPSPDWKVGGIWQYSAGMTLRFGGYSGLLALDDKMLRAFSDRGYRFTFTVPDDPRETERNRTVEIQQAGGEEGGIYFWDIESAAQDPETGDYWLGYEREHSIHRFTAADAPKGVRMLNDQFDWGGNGGLEAMVRLSDGQFLAIPEGRSYALLFPADPVAGSEPQRIAFTNPAESFAVTDVGQLPDGRLLLLMRNVVRGIPPFEGLIAIADVPVAGVAWSPRVALTFEGVLPPDNYEGLAVRERADGSVAVWVMSDDNLSIMQRTLLAKLIFDPAKAR